MLCLAYLIAPKTKRDISLPIMGFLSVAENQPLWLLASVAVASFATVFVLFKIVHRRFFSAYSDIPGPVLGSVSTLWQIWHIILGDTELAVNKEHRKHGTTDCGFKLNYETNANTVYRALCTHWLQ